jgi:hypothetical protein
LYFSSNSALPNSPCCSCCWDHCTYVNTTGSLCSLGAGRLEHRLKKNWTEKVRHFGTKCYWNVPRFRWSVVSHWSIVPVWVPAIHIIVASSRFLVVTTWSSIVWRRRPTLAKLCNVSFFSIEQK